MKHEDFVKMRVKTYVDNHQKYEFPDFLRMLREAHRLGRPQIEEDTEISRMKLFFLETGQFSRMPIKESLIRLALYYGVPESLLIEKAYEYVKDIDKSKYFRKLRRVA